MAIPSQMIKVFKCCKDGEMLKSSEETANCSFCGQFFIFKVSTRLSYKLCRKRAPSSRPSEKRAGNSNSIFQWLKSLTG